MQKAYKSDKVYRYVIHSKSKTRFTDVIKDKIINRINKFSNLDITPNQQNPNAFAIFTANLVIP